MRLYPAATCLAISNAQSGRSFTCPYALVLGQASYEAYVSELTPRIHPIVFDGQMLFSKEVALFVEYNELGEIRRLTLPSLHPSTAY